MTVEESDGLCCSWARRIARLAQVLRTSKQALLSLRIRETASARYYSLWCNQAMSWLTGILRNWVGHVRYVKYDTESRSMHIALALLFFLRLCSFLSVAQPNTPS